MVQFGASAINQERNKQIQQEQARGQGSKQRSKPVIPQLRETAGRFDAEVQRQTSTGDRQHADQITKGGRDDRTKVKQIRAGWMIVRA